MQTICGLLSLVFIGVVGWLGAVRSPLWVPFVAAVIGCVLYFGIKGPALLAHLQREGAPRFLAMIYGTQVITSFIPYGIGYAVGTAFR